MIFVTVGTHEQPFDRLLKEVDKLAGNKIIDEKVIMQTGFSEYVPQHTEWKSFFSYDEMDKMIKDARIVITHGGPASFLNVMSKGKIPIVVPRLSEFNEHVNNHQLIFVQQLIERGYDISLVNPIGELSKIMRQFDERKENYASHNKLFMASFEKTINDLF